MKWRSREGLAASHHPNRSLLSERAEGRGGYESSPRDLLSGTRIIK